MEIELKYRFRSHASVVRLLDDPQVRQVACNPWQTHELHNRYFDTPDQRLRDAGIGLRLRSDGEIIVLCCKYQGSSDHSEQGSPEEGCRELRPPALSQRQEEEIVLEKMPANPADLPWHLLPCAVMLSKILGDESLEEIAVSDFKRQVLCLAWRASKVELALDEGFLIRKEKRSALLELELELKEGNLEDLCQLGEILAERYELVAEPKSKLQRALEV
ncbi:MAG: CYTH domain-containing protein [Symbiobacteriaceae bacterium]|nr:CYTH domain-containing protein [Symbiobacteriaceae bacterium]